MDMELKLFSYNASIFYPYGYMNSWLRHHYIPRTERSGDVMVLRQSRPPPAARRPPPATRRPPPAMVLKR